MTRKKSGPLYPNQPLQEVATEIRFHGRLRVEQVRADFQDAIQSRYRTLFVPRALPQTAPAMQHYRFESAGEGCGVQVSVNAFNVYARDYPGFDRFFAETKRLAEIFTSLVGDLNVTRIGWRYINAIPFPRENDRLPFAKIFRSQPWLASALEGEWKGYALVARMPFGGVMTNVSLAAGTEEDTSKSETLIFDIDAFSTFDPPLERATLKRCLSEIKKAHDAAREVFELSINDDYRAFLKGSAE